MRLVEGSPKVGMAAILPVSAFGFGTAVPAPEEDEDADRGRGFSPLSEGETEWLPRPDTNPTPFN